MSGGTHEHIAYAPVHCCGVDGNAVIDDETGEPIELRCPICGHVYRYPDEDAEDAAERGLL